jgi:hypothetical protein
MAHTYRTIRCSIFKRELSLQAHRSLGLTKTFAHVRRRGWKTGKTIPVTGREVPLGCETSKLPHFLHNRLTDGGEVVSRTRRPPFTPRYSFLLEAESIPRP